MRIAHLFPKYHGNVGDHLVQRGILRLLRERLGPFEYTAVSTRKTGPDPGEATGITSRTLDLLNRQDLVVIGGSNLYEAAGGQWGVQVEPGAVARLTAPVLLLGIGGGWSFAFPEFPAWPENVAEDVRGLHARALGSSVRDDLTKRLLDGHGIGPATMTGCPATFLAADPPRSSARGIVGLPFLPKRMYAGPTLDPRRWKSPTQARRRAVTRYFLGLLKELPRRGWETRVLVHDSADLPLARRLVGDAAFFSPEPEELFRAIGECDVIVGFRLHAAITALGLGIPTIPVLLDGRNAAFVETFGLTEHAVSLDPAAVSLTVERIALALSGERRRWAPVFARRDALRQRMSDFLDGALAAAPSAGASTRSAGQGNAP